MIAYLIHDPETTRVALQLTEPGEESFPPGLRGLGWEVRRIDVPQEVVDDLLAGELSPEDQTLLHRDLWAREDTSA